MTFRNPVYCPAHFFMALAISTATADAALAQGQGWLPPDATMFEKEGTVAGVAPGAIQMLTDQNSPWIIQVSRQSQVKITGTAELGFLRPGIPIKFTGEIDAKGVLQAELAELEIFTPAGKGSVGVFPTGAEEAAKPIAKLEPGSYEIRGKVVKLNDREITIAAGKKITGTLAEDAKIAVNVSDISVAQKDDALTVKGFYYARFAPAQGRPGQAVGKEIEITLSKPLAGIPKKGASKPARQPRGKQPDAPSDVNTDDPFGLEKAGGGEKD